MSMIAAEDLGYRKNTEVLKGLIDLEGMHVVDVGCGDLTFSKILAELGASVLAIDPDSVQAEKNRTQTIENVEFAEAGATEIPVDSGVLDGVFFSYSLHHVPADLYSQVFAEVVRVLKPDGFLYVLEPTDCHLNQVMRLFHDEDQERAAAQTAILNLAAPRFEEMIAVSYHDFRQYDSFDDFVKVFSSKSFNSLYSESDVRTPQVEAEFMRRGGADLCFESPKLAVLLKGVKPLSI